MVDIFAKMLISDVFDIFLAGWGVLPETFIFNVSQFELWGFSDAILSALFGLKPLGNETVSLSDESSVCQIERLSLSDRTHQFVR